MNIPILTAFLLPVLISITVTPWVIRLAKLVGATDMPDHRKVHKVITPRIGGLTLFISVAVTVSLMTFITPQYLGELSEHYKLSLILSGCLTAIFILGFWDDLKPLKPGVKFGVQFLVATVIYFAGFKISNITNPLGSGVLNVEVIDFPLTLIWIVGITNAFNLIDGLDGLASGVATIACVSIFTVSAFTGQVATAFLALIMAGALVGFLRYNFNPAKIFLGDSGSLFIGFSLALMSIQSTTKISTGFALLFPLLVLVLPITDTFVSMIRRLLGSMLYNKTENPQSLVQKFNGMFVPDKSHIHHRLLSLGLSHRNAVLLLYSISGFFALGAFVITQINSFQQAFSLALFFAVILFIAIKKLRYHEISILNNGLIMPFFERWFLQKSMYARFFDSAFIVISCLASYMILHNLDLTFAPSFSQTAQTFVILISIQISVFMLSGLYRQNIRLIGIGSILKVISTVTYAVVLSSIILYFQTNISLANTMLYFFFDFYLLLTLSLGSRIAYQVLNFWFNREKKGNKNILIYGASKEGALMLQHLHNSSANGYKVIGFLDDDPEMENKKFDGYPVWGGHWQLPKVIKEYSINSIFICKDNIKPENFRRLSQIANTHGIEVKRLHIELETIGANNIAKAIKGSSKPIVSFG